MLDNGISMADIDRMEFGLYMQILREREKRRAERKEKDEARMPRSGGDGESAVYLHRGKIDEVW